MSGHEQPGLFDGPTEIERNPVKPYAGEHGSSGTATSRARAESGTLGRSQARIVHALALVGRHGATVAELRSAQTLNDMHHGTISGALSELHKAGVIFRLTEVRKRCRVYVTAGHVEGREFDRPKGTASGLANRLRSCEEREVDYVEHVRFDGHDYYLAADLLEALMDGY